MCEFLKMLKICTLIIFRKYLWINSLFYKLVSKGNERRNPLFLLETISQENFNFWKLNVKFNFSLNPCKHILCKHRSSLQNSLARNIINVSRVCSWHNTKWSKNAPKEPGNETKTQSQPAAFEQWHRIHQAISYHETPVTSQDCVVCALKSVFESIFLCWLLAHGYLSLSITSEEIKIIYWSILTSHHYLWCELFPNDSNACNNKWDKLSPTKQVRWKNQMNCDKIR